MASYLPVLLMVVLVQGTLSCRYFCRNNATSTYDCCDDQVPAVTNQHEGDSGDTTTNSQQGMSGVDQGLVGVDQGLVGVDQGLLDGATEPPVSMATEIDSDGAEFPIKGCRYYCSYGGSVYCCDDGSLSMPGDHNNNVGRCPTTGEQVCKEDAVYLHLKAHKLGTTKSGSTELAKVGSSAVKCASDGYCSEDEKCCPSVCHKRHVCLKTLHQDKTKN